MSSFAKWSDSALPSVLQSLSELASAGPIQSGPLFEAAHVVGPLPLDVLRVTGRDRVRFLHAMLSNDVLLLDGAGPGHGIRATLSSVQGRLVADVHLYLVDPEKKTGCSLAVFEPGAAAPFTEMLDKYIIAEKVYFEPEEFVGLAVVGPGATEALQTAGAPVPGPQPHQHCEASLGGATVRILRRELGPPDSFLMLVAPAELEQVVQALALPMASAAQLEAARIEAALPRAGGDATSLHIALEAGLKERAVSFTKGCYIGQEVICRIDSMGTPARLLVQLQGGGTAPTPGTELFAGGRVVGYVTSSVQSGRNGAPVFLGYVKKKSNDVGADVAIGEADGPLASILAHV